MPLYDNALDIYSSNMDLGNGTTYSHRYKAVLEQIHKVIRQIVAAEKLTDIRLFERELDRLDAARKKLEDKLIAVYPGIGEVLKAIVDDNKKDVAVAFGNYDAETDGVGVLMLNNMLGLQGSESLAVERVKEKIRRL